MTELAKFCIDCKHHRTASNIHPHKCGDYCAANESRNNNPVDGAFVDCRAMRGFSHECKISALLFEPRETEK